MRRHGFSAPLMLPESHHWLFVGVPWRLDEMPLAGVYGGGDEGFYRLQEYMLQQDYLQSDESTVPIINNEKHQTVKGYVSVVKVFGQANKLLNICFIKIDTTLCLLRHNVVSIGVQRCAYCDTMLYLLNLFCSFGLSKMH